MLVVLEFRDRHLVCAPCAFHGLAINHLRAGPALGRTQHDHGPARTLCLRGIAFACFLLDARDVVKTAIQRGRKGLVHGLEFMAFDEVGLIAVTTHEIA